MRAGVTVNVGGWDAATIFDRDHEVCGTMCVFIFVLVEIDIKNNITQ